MIDKPFYKHEFITDIINSIDKDNKLYFCFKVRSSRSKMNNFIKIFLINGNKTVEITFLLANNFYILNKNQELKIVGLSKYLNFKMIISDRIKEVIELDCIEIILTDFS